MQSLGCDAGHKLRRFNRLRIKRVRDIEVAEDHLLNGNLAGEWRDTLAGLGNVEVPDRARFDGAAGEKPARGERDDQAGED